MLHAVNTQHGLQRIGPSAIARLGIGVRLEKGNYPTLSAFFAQMATD